MFASTLWFPTDGHTQKTPVRGVGVAGDVDRVTVVIASGKRPVTFRTRKLRLTAPMVLHSGGCGRVGHRRTPFSGGWFTVLWTSPLFLCPKTMRDRQRKRRPPRSVGAAFSRFRGDVAREYCSQGLLELEGVRHGRALARLGELACDSAEVEHRVGAAHNL